MSGLVSVNHEAYGPRKHAWNRHATTYEKVDPDGVQLHGKASLKSLTDYAPTRYKLQKGVSKPPVDYQKIFKNRLDVASLGSSVPANTPVSMGPTVERVVERFIDRPQAMPVQQQPFGQQERLDFDSLRSQIVDQVSVKLESFTENVERQKSEQQQQAEYLRGQVENIASGLSNVNESFKDTTAQLLESSAMTRNELEFVSGRVDDVIQNVPKPEQIVAQNRQDMQVLFDGIIGQNAQEQFLYAQGFNDVKKNLEFATRAFFTQGEMNQAFAAQNNVMLQEILSMYERARIEPQNSTYVNQTFQAINNYASVLQQNTELTQNRIEMSASINSNTTQPPKGPRMGFTEFYNSNIRKDITAPETEPIVTFPEETSTKKRKGSPADELALPEVLPKKQRAVRETKRKALPTNERGLIEPATKKQRAERDNKRKGSPNDELTLIEPATKKQRAVRENKRKALPTNEKKLIEPPKKKQSAVRENIRLALPTNERLAIEDKRKTKGVPYATRVQPKRSAKK